MAGSDSSDRTNHIRFAAAFFILVFFVPSVVSAQDLPILTAEFWLELEPHIRVQGGTAETNDERIERLLREAQFVFSGMIYGFSFRYVPLDRRRGVEEELEVDPVATIKWGDPALSVVDARIDSGRHRALIRYNVGEKQRHWIDHWQSNIFERSTGYGRGNVFKGEDQKRRAVENGIREAIRNYLRPREYNKPKEIAGFAAFSEEPYIIIDEGFYKAKVLVKLDIRSVVPYKMH